MTKRPKGTERRQEVRKPVNWPGQVEWKGDGQTHVKQAIIRNYSAGGVYFELEGADLKPGMPAECKMEMPAEIAFGGGVILYCVGEVVHVRPLEGGESRIGVGFRTDEFSFVEETGKTRR